MTTCHLVWNDLVVKEPTGRIEEILVMNISDVLLHNPSEKALPFKFAMSTAWCILNVVEIVKAEIDGLIIPLVLPLDSFAQFYLDWLDSGRCPQCFHAPLIFLHIVSQCLPRLVGEFSKDIHLDLPDCGGGDVNLENLKFSSDRVSTGARQF